MKMKKQIQGQKEKNRPIECMNCGQLIYNCECNEFKR